MNLDHWFDDVTQRHVEGRFINVDVVDALATGIDYHAPVMKSALAVETRCRALYAGANDSTITRVKPHNQEELIARFPKAWEFYQAAREGREIASEPKTPFRIGVLTKTQAQSLSLDGVGTVERALALSDSDAVRLLGKDGVEIREALRLEASRLQQSHTISPPAATLLEEGGPIDALTIAILESRAVNTFEQLASWTDSAAWAYLGAKGIEARAYAQAELVRKASPPVQPVNPVLAAHGLDTKEKVSKAAAMIDKAVRKAGGDEKQSKSKRV